MTQAFNYIAAILVVFFGLWLFSGSNRQYHPHSVTTNDVADATDEIQAVMEPHYRDSPNSEMPMDSTDNQDVTSYPAPAVGNSMQPVANSRSFPADNVRPGAAYQYQSPDHDQISVAVDNSAEDSVSDADWFSGLMNKARSIGDRIINIDISGKSSQSAVNNNTGGDEESLLPQPTETESLADNKVNCASVMYMGGNDYGRNMLIKMGCPVP